MKVRTTFDADISAKKAASGAYEWWYFDAISDDGETKLVIIFYEGNPFSRRYIKAQGNGQKQDAQDFPAITISVYQHQQPVYYSFREVDPSHASFSRHSPELRIADHTMKGQKKEGRLVYDISLKEKLPSGDAIVGNLTFSSPEPGPSMLSNDASSADGKGNHQWGLIQPRATVEGRLECRARGEKPRTISFRGSGYHDHNIGHEPLKNEFADWYWGRFHFNRGTFIYYTSAEEQQAAGWLLSPDGKKVVDEFTNCKLEDLQLNVFALSSARKLTLSNAHAHVMIQQVHVLDNGPFYQRFSSDAFLNIPGEQLVESRMGLTEYLAPPRIYKKRFWPLTNMRINYEPEGPHWVQRSKVLYRWTW